jgi:hypothetical protein
MSQDIELLCGCGEVQGRVTDVSPKTVNRALCYCNDCQAYLHHLGRADLLDEHGGSDVVQVAPASLAFVRGSERIVGVRLQPNGLFRWYAGCCNTPVGNTLSPAFPMVGIVAAAFEVGKYGRDEVFGKPVGASFARFAIGSAPAGSTRVNLRVLTRAIAMIARWRITGRTWPHPFFDRASRAPSHPVTTLTRAERDALSPFCGPRPVAGSEG